MKQVACILCKPHNYFPPFHSWGCSQDVWLNMLKKETRYVHDKHFEVLHSDLEPQMRSILLDWLLEVCSSNTYFIFLCIMEKYLDVNMLSMCSHGKYYILLPGAAWGGEGCLVYLMIPMWKMTVYKSKVMRAATMSIQPKPNSEFLVSQYCWGLGAVCSRCQDEHNIYIVDKVLIFCYASEGLVFRTFRNPFLHHQNQIIIWNPFSLS